MLVTRVPDAEPGRRHAVILAIPLVATLAIPDTYIQRREVVQVVLTEKEGTRGGPCKTRVLLAVGSTAPFPSTRRSSLVLLTYAGSAKTQGCSCCSGEHQHPPMPFFSSRTSTQTPATIRATPQYHRLLLYYTSVTFSKLCPEFTTGIKAFHNQQKKSCFQPFSSSKLTAVDRLPFQTCHVTCSQLPCPRGWSGSSFSFPLPHRGGV